MPEDACAGKEFALLRCVPKPTVAPQVVREQDVAPLRDAGAIREANQVCAHLDQPNRLLNGPGVATADGDRPHGDAARPVLGHDGIVASMPW